MSHKTQPAQHKPVENLFRLKPLVACMRVIIAGGLFAGSVAPVYAELPIPGVGAAFSPTGVAMPWLGSGDATNQIVHDASQSHKDDPRYDTLRIDQKTPKVILNWESFNVGRDNTVKFVQPDASSVALNRIYQGDPSQILGHITANGQIYLVNQNGFVFGKDSVVDTNTLVASALDISKDTFEKGIIRVFDQNKGAKDLNNKPLDQAAFIGDTSIIRFDKGLKTDSDGFLTDISKSQVLDQTGNKIHIDQGGHNPQGQVIKADGSTINFVGNAKGQLVYKDNNVDKVVLDTHGNPIVLAPVQIRFEKGLKTDSDGFLTDNNNNQVLDQLGHKIPVEQGFATNTKGQLIAGNGQVVLDKQGNAIEPVSVKAHIHTGKNGNIIIVAPVIDNAGSLSTEQQGQILMAASEDKVYLQPTSSNDPFAGLLVEVGKGGTVTNQATGEISVRQGNVTLAGFAVNQSGRISATTSVNVNGSVRLLARENPDILNLPDDVPDATKPSIHYLKPIQDSTKTIRNDGLESSVTFGSNSSVSVLADADGGSAIDEQIQNQSIVEVSAANIKMETGSSIVATSGKVSLTATDNVFDPLLGTKGDIKLESGSNIDVSGTKNVKVAMERNVADISVQSINLRDAPYQRGGVLQGQTVQVDIRNLPTIVDASSASASIKRGIDERLSGENKILDVTTGQLKTVANSGVINLTSSGNVAVKSGAVANISGGSVNYQDGYINTTKLVSTTGRIVDIANADPNEQFSSIFGKVIESHAKWGVTDTWNTQGQLSVGRFEKGYREGKAGGAFNIVSPNTDWNGQLIAGSVSSIYQRSQPVSGGTFTLNQGDKEVPFFSQQDVKVQIDLKNAKNQEGDLVLPTAFFNQSGISNVIIKTGGSFTIENDAALSMPVLSKLKVEASKVDVIGSIYTAGGTLSLKSINNISLPDSGILNVSPSAVLDVSGRWVNDFQNGSAPLTSPVVINAGTVNLDANNELNFNKDAVIKADGGAWLSSNGTRLTAGKAGNINLSAGTPLINGLVNVDGSLSAYGLNEGGSLSLTSNQIVIGATSAKGDKILNLGVTNGELNVAANAGFSSVSLISNVENITVKEHTKLSLISQNRMLNPDYRNRADSNSIKDFSQVLTLPENIIKPVTLSLTGKNGVMLETDSMIHVDKASTVNLSSGIEGKGIEIDGTIEALAGKINLILKKSDLVDTGALTGTYSNSQAIWLGANAHLNVQGTTLFNPVDALGRITGSVLKGGDVTIQANRGYVVIEKSKEGDTINVSGTSTGLDLPVSNSGGLGIQTSHQNIGSDAGKISISAAEGIVFNGTVNAKAGSVTNRGGSLDLTLDRNQRKEPVGDESFFKELQYKPLQFNVVQEAKDAQIILPSNPNLESNLDSYNGKATISSQQISQAGIDQLRLSVPLQNVNPFNKDPITQIPLPPVPGVIQFIGDVNLTTASSLILDAQTINWSGVTGGLQNGMVNLNTAYLQLGSSTFNTVAGTPLLGGGTLTTNATWTQLNGALLMTGFKEINLNSAHDLRAVGVQYVDTNVTGSTPEYLATNRTLTGNLSTAANLNLKASQIYPTTLTDYTFAVTDPAGKLTITGSNTDATPLSAAGKLTLNAHTINQNGVLKAPLGTIELNTKLSKYPAADATGTLSFGKDSVTSVSANGQKILLGAIVNNVWEYPLAGNINLVFNKSLLNPDTGLYEYLALGEKHLVFQAPDIQFERGSIVDVSGGGDLLATQFQPGIGGSADYLQSGSSSYQGGFAILPSLGSSLAAFDPNLSSGFGYNPGAMIHLSGTGALPTGDYAMLPAYYALLPGAYLVTPQGIKTQDQILTSFTKSGLPIVSGYQEVAGTNAGDSRTSGFLIESSADVKKHSTYDIQSADSFFAKQAASTNTAVPLLPQDSGQISIDASTRLVLDGQFTVAAPNGRGAKLDISSQDIEVVNFDPSLMPVKPDTLQLWDQSLSKLHVDSLFLGGKRQSDRLTGNTNLNVTADNVTFTEGSQVQALDLIAAAKNKIEVMKDATISSSGSVNTGDSVFNLTGDSALLRVSADKQITVNRTSSSGLTGDLLIDQGAILAASKSMLLDGSKSTVLNGDIDMRGGALTLTANTINFGEITGNHSNDLNLSIDKLPSLAVDDLVLNSRGAINFYGNVGQLDNNGHLAPIHFNNLTLDTTALSGFDNAGKATKLQANNLVLQNSQAIATVNPGSGSGTLDLTATHYSQSGTFGVDGFKTVNINVDNQFVATGNSVMNVASDLNLTAGNFTTSGGHSLTFNTGGHDVVISGNADTSKYSSGDFGGSIIVAANDITVNSAKVLLPSGTLKLQAQTYENKDIGDILINGKTDINLAGKAVNFADTMDYTPGGTFSAVANQGKILSEKGSNIDISTGGGNGAGGKLILKAPEKTVELAGNIKATGGSAILDVGKFTASKQFDDLMDKLNAAGVTNSLYVRTRNDSIIQAAGKVLTANSIDLVADKGGIDIFGTLNANGLKDGGTINLYAGGKIILEGGSRLSATGGNGVDGVNGVKGIDAGNGKNGSIGGKGGKVLLSSVDGDGKGISDGIVLMEDSLVNVSAGKGGKGGKSAVGVTDAKDGVDGVDGIGGDVILRALRNGNDVNIAPVLGTIKGYNQFYAEGVRKYTNADLSAPDSGEINSADIIKITGETKDYMDAAAQDVDNRLGGGIHLRPGVEIDYTGDLALASAWDFSSERYGKNLEIPGNLIIRTDGKLTLNKSLTDGFQGDISQGAPLQDGNSWSFQLVSGADLTSSDKFSTIDLNGVEYLANATSKDLTIGSGVSVHTGSGDIKLASGGNFVLTDQTSTVYSAGHKSKLSNPPYKNFVAAGEYPEAGGDVVIRAGADIKGTQNGTTVTGTIIGNILTISDVKPGFILEVGQNVQAIDDVGAVVVSKITAIDSVVGGTGTYELSDNFVHPVMTKPSIDVTSSQFLHPWLLSQGTNAISSRNKSLTAWSVDASKFEQNIGSFGGGKVNIGASGNINDLSVMMPTTGKQTGTGFEDNKVEVQGGGQMRVHALGDISGGAYFLGKGEGSITAEGEIKGSTSTAPDAFTGGPQIVMSGDQSNMIDGSANMSLNAGKGIKIAAVSDAMVLNVIGATGSTQFFTYTDKSKLLLKSLSGDIHLNSDTKVVTDILKMPNTFTTVYPASLDVTAFGGSVKLENDIILFPSKDKNSNLNVLAKQGIVSDTGLHSIIMSDADPDLKIANAYLTINVGDTKVVGDTENIFNIINNVSNTIHALTPIHNVDLQPARIVTQTGDISSVQFILPKKSIIQSGRDLINSPIQVQNINQDDGSVISAGRDIIFTTVLDKNGASSNNDLNQISISGPGNALIKSGRNLDLGTSTGLITVGNTTNPALPLAGASLDVLVGLNEGTPSYKAFIDKYLHKNPLYAEQLILVKAVITPFMNRLTGNALSDAEALNEFSKLTGDQTLAIQPQLNAILNGVFFNELKIAGSGSAANKSAGNQGGFEAIDTLFPGNAWQGDLSLFFSKLQTINGGDINLLVPGGQVNAGLAVAPSGSGAKSADQLGIVAQRQGNINAFVKNDFTVNTSRVFTLGGGDILIWSSEGNIDAGKGAKSALSVTMDPPYYDANDKLVYPAPKITSGSGIRTAASLGVPAGNVFLFAPKGVVDAGEAGIGGSNVTISATAVLGANNIQVSGTSTGVPVASVGSVAAGLTGTSNVTANASQVAQAAMGDEDKEKADNKNMTLGMLSVELLGFGE